MPCGKRKTAIICSGVMPEYVWLATGGKQNFKAEKCECLKGRKVILYPDLGAFEDWKTRGNNRPECRILFVRI